MKSSTVGDEFYILYLQNNSCSGVRYATKIDVARAAEKIVAETQQDVYILKVVEKLEVIRPMEIKVTTFGLSSNA